MKGETSKSLNFSAEKTFSHDVPAALDDSLLQQ